MGTMILYKATLCLPLLICLGCGNSTDGPASNTGGLSGAGGNPGDGGAAGHSGMNTAGTTTGPEACFEGLEPAPDQRLEIQRFKTADGALRLWRARETTPDPTVGETMAFKLVRFWVQSELDPDTCLRDPASLHYDYAHHNWNDSWTATTSHAVYAGHEQFDNNGSELYWIDRLTITTPEGDPISSELKLLDDGCVSKPLDYNVCMQRKRLDESP